MSPKRWKQPPKGVVDTSVLVAGISGFRDEPSDNPSAALIAAWAEAPTFVWLLTEGSLSEYVEVLEGLHVRSARTIVALIREQGQSFAFSRQFLTCQIETTHHSASARNRPTPPSSLPRIQAIGPARGVVTPSPTTYRCRTQTFRVAFEEQRAYITMPDGSLVTLRRLKSGSDPEQPRAFSDGRVTFVQEIEGAGGPRVLFARGRIVPAPCTRQRLN